MDILHNMKNSQMLGDFFKVPFYEDAFYLHEVAS